MEGAWLTLTTCHPEYCASEWLVVFAKLIGGANAKAIAERYPADYSRPVEPGTWDINPGSAPASE